MPGLPRLIGALGRDLRNPATPEAARRAQVSHVWDTTEGYPEPSALDGRLVAYWLDRFGEPILTSYAGTSWPQTLVLDSTEFLETNVWTAFRQAVHAAPQLAVVRQLIERRAWTFRNLARMNALLGLVRLHINRRDVPADWAQLLAAHLRDRPTTTSLIDEPAYLLDGSREYSLRKHPVPAKM